MLQPRHRLRRSVCSHERAFEEGELWTLHNWNLWPIPGGHRMEGWGRRPSCHVLRETRPPPYHGCKCGRSICTLCIPWSVLTLQICSNDPCFIERMAGMTVNGTTYLGIRARTTGAPQNHWFGPAGDPRGAGIGTIEWVLLQLPLIYHIS